MSLTIILVIMGATVLGSIAGGIGGAFGERYVTNKKTSDRRVVYPHTNRNYYAEELRKLLGDDYLSFSGAKSRGEAVKKALPCRWCDDWNASHAAADCPDAPRDEVIKKARIDVTTMADTPGSQHIAGETRATDPKTGAQKGRKPEAYSLLPVEALAEVARVYNYGATKYSPNNWRKGYPWSWSQDAKGRHNAAFWSGQDKDEESGHYHLAHEVFHSLTQLQYQIEGNGTDDRYHPQN